MTKVIALRISDDLALRLEKLARKTNRNKTFYIKEALIAHIADLEDIYAADEVMERVSLGSEAIVPLEDVLTEYGMEN